MPRGSPGTASLRRDARPGQIQIRYKQTNTDAGAAPMLLYESLATQLRQQIERGTLRAGERLPSIR